MAAEARLRGHLRAGHLARHRLQPGQDQSGVPRRLQPRANQRVPRAAGRPRLQPALQPRRARQPAVDGAAEFRGQPGRRRLPSPTSRRTRSPDWPTSHGAAASPGALATFMQNPGIYASQAIVNGGFSDYNALQLELRRQYRNGFFGQFSYTFPDTNTNSAGDGAEPVRGVHGQQSARAEHGPVGVPRHARDQRQRHLRAAVRPGQALA